MSTTSVQPPPVHPRNEIEIVAHDGSSSAGYALLRVVMWQLIQRQKQRKAQQQLLIDRKYLLSEEEQGS